MEKGNWIYVNWSKIFPFKWKSFPPFFANRALEHFRNGTHISSSTKNSWMNCLKRWQKLLELRRGRERRNRRRHWSETTTWTFLEWSLSSKNTSTISWRRFFVAVVSGSHRISRTSSLYSEKSAAEQILLCHTRISEGRMAIRNERTTSSRGFGESGKDAHQRDVQTNCQGSMAKSRAAQRAASLGVEANWSWVQRSLLEEESLLPKVSLEGAAWSV